MIDALELYDVRLAHSDLGTPSLKREVAALRCGLDYEGTWGSKDSRCGDLLNTTYTPDDYDAGKPMPFDSARVHTLYKALFGQIEDLIKGKHLLVVPSGALTQLPFQVLVTEPPQVGPGQRTAWLVRDHAITVLPSVSSLKALRAHSHTAGNRKPFLDLAEMHGGLVLGSRSVYARRATGMIS